MSKRYFAVAFTVRNYRGVGDANTDWFTGLFRTDVQSFLGARLVEAINKDEAYGIIAHALNEEYPKASGWEHNIVVAGGIDE